MTTTLDFSPRIYFNRAVKRLIALVLLAGSIRISLTCGMKRMSIAITALLAFTTASLADLPYSFLRVHTPATNADLIVTGLDWIDGNVSLTLSNRPGGGGLIARLTTAGGGSGSGSGLSNIVVGVGMTGGGTSATVNVGIDGSYWDTVSNRVAAINALHLGSAATNNYADFLPAGALTGYSTSNVLASAWNANILALSNTVWSAGFLTTVPNPYLWTNTVNAGGYSLSNTTSIISTGSLNLIGTPINLNGQAIGALFAPITVTNLNVAGLPFDPIGAAANVSHATNADFSTTGNYATNSKTAIFASSALYATNSGSATFSASSLYATGSLYSASSGIATNANYALQAGFATNSGYSTSGTFATNSGFALSANSATSAVVATTAGLASNANYATIAVTSSNALQLGGVAASNYPTNGSNYAGNGSALTGITATQVGAANVNLGFTNGVPQGSITDTNQDGSTRTTTNGLRVGVTAATVTFLTNNTGTAASPTVNLNGGTVATVVQTNQISLKYDGQLPNTTNDLNGISLDLNPTQATANQYIRNGISLYNASTNAMTNYVMFTFTYPKSGATNINLGFYRSAYTGMVSNNFLAFNWTNRLSGTSIYSDIFTVSVNAASTWTNTTLVVPSFTNLPVGATVQGWWYATPYSTNGASAVQWFTLESEAQIW